MRLGLTATLGILATLAIAATAFLFAPKARSSDPMQPVAITLGGEKLNIPAGYLRPDSRQGGAMDALELAALFPGFTPAGETRDIDARTDLSDRFARVVFVTARPSDLSLYPAERPARLYARFLDQTSWSHPGGLVARAFTPGSPFEGDELYYVEPEGREFAARCRRPDPERKTPNTCIYDFRVGDLDIEMRFSAGLLAEWASLKSAARSLIETSRP